MKIKVPFLENGAIWKKADDFRKSLEPEGCDLPPINILYVVDVILKLDIIELPDLFASQHIDAALLPDLSGIYTVFKPQTSFWKPLIPNARKP